MNNAFLMLCQLVVIFTCRLHVSVAREAIIGGHKVELINDFAYHVSLQIRGKDRCSGGIINDQFILTAAHCVVNDDGQFRRARWSIFAGTHDLQRENGHLVVHARAKKIFVPTEYISTSHDATGDIAIIKLSQSFALSRNKHLKRLKLPRNQYQNYAGETARVAGFGWNWIKINGNKYTGGNTDFQLRYAETDVLSRGQKGCPEKNVSKKQLCARVRQLADKDTRGVCVGDSGAPLVYNEIVIGVLSMSPFACIENTTAAVYTRVSRYLDFIDYAIKDKPTKYIRTYELHQRDANSYERQRSRSVSLNL